MPQQVASPYFTDPTIGIAASNIAQMFAPPSQAELAQMELLRAQTMGQNIDNKSAGFELDSRQNLAGLMSGLVGPDGTMDPAMIGQLYAGLANSGNAGEATELVRGMLALHGYNNNDEDMMRAGLVGAGQMPDAGFAPTERRADDLIRQGHENSIAEIWNTAAAEAAHPSGDNRISLSETGLFQTPDGQVVRLPLADGMNARLTPVEGTVALGGLENETRTTNSTISDTIADNTREDRRFEADVTDQTHSRMMAERQHMLAREQLELDRDTLAHEMANDAQAASQDQWREERLEALNDAGAIDVEILARLNPNTDEPQVEIPYEAMNAVRDRVAEILRDTSIPPDRTAAVARAVDEMLERDESSRWFGRSRISADLREDALPNVMSDGAQAPAPAPAPVPQMLFGRQPVGQPGPNAPEPGHVDPETGLTYIGGDAGIRENWINRS